MASHELRAPLTAIRGFSSTMVQMWDSLPEEQRRNFVGIIDAQAERLARMVDDILTVSSLERGHIDAHPRPTLVGPVIEGVLSALQHDGTAEVSCDSDLRAHVDRDHLEQILFNYLTNAYKYGAPPIEVVARPDRDWARIEVIDHGAGVPPEFTPRLFAAFARAEHDGYERQAGTGLGLSIVRGLAEAHGGQAWYEPNTPTGSRFVVRLQRVRFGPLD